MSGLAVTSWIQFLSVNDQSIYGIAALLGASGTILTISSQAITNDLIASNTETGAFVFGVMSFADKLVNGAAIMATQLLQPTSFVDCLLHSKMWLLNVFILQDKPRNALGLLRQSDGVCPDSSLFVCLGFCVSVAESDCWSTKSSDRLDSTHRSTETGVIYVVLVVINSFLSLENFFDESPVFYIPFYCFYRITADIYILIRIFFFFTLSSLIVGSKLISLDSEGSENVGGD